AAVAPRPAPTAPALVRNSPRPAPVVAPNPSTDTAGSVSTLPDRHAGGKPTPPPVPARNRVATAPDRRGIPRDDDEEPRPWLDAVSPVAVTLSGVGLVCSSIAALCFLVIPL